MKQFVIGLMCFVLAGVLCGCSVETSSTEKLRDLEFTVMQKEDIPEEMKATIEQKQKEPFKITYGDQNYLYIAQGYGEQQTSGYSIEVKECYETKNAIYVHMNLIGPSKEENIKEATTCPYIVIKLEYSDKSVVFE